MSQPELASCPWCSEKPHYYEGHLLTNMSHKFGTQYGVENVRDRETQSIECRNLQCPIRPRLMRIESGDAVTIWNSYEDNFPL